MHDNSCSKGNSCHFAHGEVELRRRNEELPVEVKFKMMHVPYNNYKTQVCKFYKANKECHYGKNCTYAHGETETRNPYQDLPSSLQGGIQSNDLKAYQQLTLS